LHVIVFRTWKITPRSLWKPLPKVSFDDVPLGHTTLPSDVKTPDSGSNCSTTVNVVVCGGAATAGTTPTAAASIATIKAVRRIPTLLDPWIDGARHYAYVTSCTRPRKAASGSQARLARDRRRADGGVLLGAGEQVAVAIDRDRDPSWPT
jgi:hypothetical protein